MKKLVIAFRNFANALKNTSQLLTDYKNPVFRIEVLYYSAFGFLFYPSQLAGLFQMYLKET